MIGGQTRLKEIVSWLGILGIPSIFAMTGWCIRKCKQYSEQLKILMEAQKAQMRGQLLQQYYSHKARGFVYSDDLDEWVNQYNAYHKLVGPNGVLDARKDELLKFPTKER